MSRSTSHHLSNMIWVSMAASENQSLVFTGDMTADKSRMIHSEVYRTTNSTLIQADAEKLIIQ